MTTVLETIKNPWLWQLAVSKEKREEYENNRKKVGIWLLNGLTETWRHLQNMKPRERNRFLKHLQQQFPEVWHEITRSELDRRLAELKRGPSE
jgi:hypothetical protein